MIFLTTKLRDIPWVIHGFFTRNNSTRDIVAGLLELEPPNIVKLKQVHGTKVVVLDKPWPEKSPPEADAIVTANPAFGIAVYASDCVPVLLASKKTKVIGAAHAGWRGALAGVLEAAIAEMVKLGADPQDITASIGPCIGFDSYEVSAGFKTPFVEQDAENAQFFAPAAKAGHLMFDLPGYVQHRLRRAGVKDVFDTRQDTLKNEGVYHSYRRSTLRGETMEGSQLSVIAIKPSRKQKKEAS